MISQGAYLENVYMADGSNAQENMYIVHSHLIGMNITAHGGKDNQLRNWTKNFCRI